MRWALEGEIVIIVISVTSISKRGVKYLSVQNMWRVLFLQTMSEKEKKRFQEMADRDKKRYELEMQDYVPAKGDKGRGKKRRHTKDPNAPKRSLSAFFWFCNDERPKVKGMNPEYGVGEIAKELGRLWSEADPEVKRKYEAMAERDKARYERVSYLL